MYYVFLCVLGIIEGPQTTIYFPGQVPIELVCNATSGIILWEVNGTFFSLALLRNGELPNHTAIGTNIVINAPVNNTKYVCVVTTNDYEISSEPAFVYIASMYICMYVAMLNACLHVLICKSIQYLHYKLSLRIS